MLNLRWLEVMQPSPGHLPQSVWMALVGWLAGWIGLPEALGASAADDARWVAQRQRMVAEDVLGAGVTSARVGAAMRDVPRHQFVPDAWRHLAYLDTSLPIGEGQTISPPYVVGRMTEELDPQPGDKVLEIGTGSGYQAAVLSALVADVYTIEIVESLGRTAAETLTRLNYVNVHTRIGDGYQGWPEAAPFDKIIVTCSPERVPEALAEQLREGGRMVVPLGERFQQTLYLLKKVGGKLETVTIEPTYFVPMTGRAEELREKKDASGLPELVNGSFESVADDGTPTGWYYARQLAAVEDRSAPDGQRVLRFSNETPGRNAQILQSLAMDGRRVRNVEVSVWTRMEQIRPGTARSQVARLEIVFFDEQRNQIGSRQLGPWAGTSKWGRKRFRVDVPTNARVAGLAVGLFGATGQLSIDHLRMEAIDGRRP